MTNPLRYGALGCVLLLSACAARGASTTTSMSAAAPVTTALASLWDAEHVSSPYSPLVDHADVERRIKALPADLFTVREAGKSGEGRAIYHVKAGTGRAGVLLWSQMHGDEPTATSALFDVFEFLRIHRTEPIAARILERLTIHAVPMLNPDGAERFQRRNAQGIDINRDALHLATPEARILKTLRDELQPVLGFNLHNQSWRTSVRKQPASISLLSVAYDEARTVNAGRLLTKRLAATVRAALEPLASGRIGKYDDSFEPRAFGDNITLWGTPVLLIETGPWPSENPDPALVRLNVIALITALDALATGRVHAADPARYDALPMNDSGLFYQVIRGGSVLRGDGTPAFRADVGLTARRRVLGRGEARELWLGTNIDDLGDLHNAGTLFEIDASGLTIAPALAGVKAGDEIRLPAWTGAAPAPRLVETGSPGALMLLRPTEDGRFRIECVLSATWSVDPREGTERGDGALRVTEPGGVQGTPPRD